MRILLVHQNFPAQFKHLVQALTAIPGNQVVVFTMNDFAGNEGLNVVRYQATRGTSPQIHPWAADFESKMIRGELAFNAAQKLKQDGFTPDVIVAHPAWGESLFLKQVWPTARLGIYCEFFYHAQGADLGFDPEFVSADAGDGCRVIAKNANNLLHMESADAGLSPTHWQASTFPAHFRHKITVAHDGIDTGRIAPASNVQLNISGLCLDRDDEVITFVSRHLEPYRGYHIFMRALPEILRRRPKARVLIVGGDKGGYGAAPPAGKSWKDIFWREIQGQLRNEAAERVHFLGQLPPPAFLVLLQISTVHVYLTYPFVLSWSLLEAMSAGCAIVASDTQPLHEVIRPGENGRLVNFFNHAQLANEVVELLNKPEERRFLADNARQLACEHYDLQTVCLPRQLAWVQRLADGHATLADVKP